MSAASTTLTPLRLALLVEDDDALANLCTLFLEGMGIVAWRAESLKVAHEALKDSPFDFVLLDLNLPDSFGTATLKSLLSAYPNARIVVMSGLCSDGVVRECIAAGALAFICKDCNLKDQIEKAVDMVVKRVQANGRREKFEEIVQEAKEDVRQVQELKRMM